MNKLHVKHIIKTVHVKHDNNNLATIGFILAFFFPFIGFCLCIAGCARSNRSEERRVGKECM